MTNAEAEKAAKDLLGPEAYVSKHTWRWKPAEYVVGIWGDGSSGEREGMPMGCGASWESALATAKMQMAREPKEDRNGI